MRLRRFLAPERRDGTVVAAYLAVALVLGGGGSPSAAAEVLVQLAFAGAAAVFLLFPGTGRAPLPRSLIILAALMVALPLLQLVPLPPALWHSLPGRETMRATLAFTGEEQSWRALSVAPPMTLAALLALVPAAGVMLAAATLGLEARAQLVRVVAIVALAGACLGALQVASGSTGTLQFYELSHRGWLTGFFANRNAVVDFLLAGSVALSARFDARARGVAPSVSAFALFLCLQAVLLLAALMTGSRAGIVLIPLALAFNFALLRRTALPRHGRLVLGGLAAFAALGLAAPWLTGSTARVGSVAERFTQGSDPRPEIWRDTAAAIAASFPAGTGLGSFTQVFPGYERVEAVTQTYANRAHNDYLEFVLEAGILAPLVLLAAAALVAARARQGLRAEREARRQALFASATLAVIALHSLVDYPLRTMALAALAGIAAALLAPPVGAAGRAGRGPQT